MAYTTEHQIILLGTDSPIGLALARELHDHGVIVHGIGGSHQSLAFSSRALASRHVREDDEASLVRQLDTIGAETGCRYVITVSESDILLLQRRRIELGNVNPLVPDPSPFSTILDKEATARHAVSVGLASPRSWTIDSMEDAHHVAADAYYPVVLKWSNPQMVAAELEQFGLPQDKCRYVHGPEELVDYLAQFEAIDRYPLIQEHARGTGIGHMLFMHDGSPALRFQHRRIHEWPPEGGFSAVCESLPPDAHPELMAKSVALLQSIGWSGPAMVEYRYDATTGAAVLMEVNGRFWGSQPLAYHAGAHFAWYLYHTARYGEPPEERSYRTHVVCRYAAPEIKRLFRILFQPKRIQDRTLRFNRLAELAYFMGRYIRPHTHYYVFSLRDPRPFMAELARSTRTAISRILKRDEKAS